MGKFMVTVGASTGSGVVVQSCMLTATSNSLLSVQGNKVATVSDKIPNTNIMPFGNCTLKPYSPPL